MAIRLATATRNAMVSAVIAQIDADASGGSIKIYSGSQPATAQDAATGTLLATVALAKPSFSAPSNGSASGADPAAVTAAATGTAGWFRLADNTGDTVFDGSVTASGGGGDMTLSSTSIVSGGSVDITSLTITMPAG